MEPSIPNKNDEFPVIMDENAANKIIDKILENEYAVIGMDTEASVEMSRFGILCLIQVKIILYFLINYSYHIMNKSIYLI
jgi:hypothetical protein